MRDMAGHLEFVPTGTRDIYLYRCPGCPARRVLFLEVRETRLARG